MLIVGGSHSDLPLIEAALMRGLVVYTTGNRPDHPGHWWSHKYVQADFSNKEAVLEVAKDIGVQYVVPGANDFAMMSAAYVAEKLGLPGYDSYDTTLLLHRKDRFKELAASIDLPICRYVVVNSSDPIAAVGKVKGLKFPLLVKPVDLTCGKGITRIESVLELESALQYAAAMSRQTDIVVEEWFDGDLHSFSTVIEDGEIVFDYCDTELCLYKDYLVSTSMSLGRISATAIHTVRDATRSMVRALRLGNGVLHSQILVHGEEVRILEYTRRMSGDLYSKVVQQVCGIRHADVFIDTAMGASVHGGLKALLPRHPFVVRHCVTSEATGSFSGLQIDGAVLPYVQSLTLAVPLGTAVTGDGTNKVATVILSFPSETDMREFVACCRKTMRCEVC